MAQGRNNRNFIPNKYILFGLTVFCVLMLFISYATGFTGGPIQNVANYIFVPMQQGLNYVGDVISVSSTDAKTKQELEEENAALTEELDELRTSLTNLQLQQSELTELQELFELSQTYSNYETTGARVVARGTSNWFNTFTIDKGTADGVTEDMNVIAGSGLVGIVTEAGTNYSTVKAIIDDTSSVSAMVLSSSDNCIVSGDLELMSSSEMIELSNLEDSEGTVAVGDAVVTSNISDKYLPGILIGYISELSDDANDLTKSGTITPVADFRHLEEVLVILQTKETWDE